MTDNWDNGSRQRIAPTSGLMLSRCHDTPCLHPMRSMPSHYILRILQTPKHPISRIGRTSNEGENRSCGEGSGDLPVENTSNGSALSKGYRTVPCAAGISRPHIYRARYAHISCALQTPSRPPIIKDRKSIRSMRKMKSLFRTRTPRPRIPCILQTSSG